MKKFMIITLGTGRGVENGVAKSIDVNNPERIIFVLTQTSLDMPKKVANALKTLYRQDMPPVDDLQEIQNESVVEEAYHTTLKAIAMARQQGYSPDEIYLDFTSGTKAMSVGAALAAFLTECKTMVYIGGFRRDEFGRVITGSEIVMSFTPNEIFADYKQRLAKRMFNSYQFDAGLKILTEIQTRITNKEISCLEKVFNAYERWDKFDHANARKLFEEIPREKIEQLGLGANKGFVVQLAKAVEAQEEYTIPEQIIDLLINAQRRAEETKFDDAVARLYRVTELLAQYRLQEGIGICVKGLKTSDLDITLLPEELRPKYETLRKDDGKIKIGLAEVFTLLGELGDQEFCNRYWENQKLRDMLKKRNVSILAHGLTPVESTIYEELVQEVMTLVRETVPNMDACIIRATMIKFQDI